MIISLYTAFSLYANILFNITAAPLYVFHFYWKPFAHQPKRASIVVLFGVILAALEKLPFFEP